MTAPERTSYLFAAVNFIADENVRNRLYWYRSDFPVREGDAVLAPIGPNDRLQAGIVEKTLVADAAGAPYDVRLVKSLAAKKGESYLKLSSAVCKELGGMRYDHKHYTRMRQILCARMTGGGTASAKANAEGEEVFPQADLTALGEYGIERILFLAPCKNSGLEALAMRKENLAAMREASRSKGGVALVDGDAVCALCLYLVGVPPERIQGAFTRLRYGDFFERYPDGEKFCRKIGLKEDEILRIRQKLT